jgi:hypothetical protein
MKYFYDYNDRSIRFTDERIEHITNSHPEMADQYENIIETLVDPDFVLQSNTDKKAELVYKHYHKTPVSEKYLVVIIVEGDSDLFMLTSYFTNTIKSGVRLWEKE